MSNSNVVYLWKWFESKKPRLEATPQLLCKYPRNLRIAGGFLAN